MTTKTIDINCLSWFDRINGNSYFAGSVTVNFGLTDEFTFNMPFQYGYDSQYETEAGQQLHKRGYLPGFGDMPHIQRYCRENDIIYRKQFSDNCKKRELTIFNKVK